MIPKTKMVTAIIIITIITMMITTTLTRTIMTIVINNHDCTKIQTIKTFPLTFRSTSSTAILSYPIFNM